MLPKTNRLCKTKDIEKAFARGKSHKNGILAVKIFENRMNSVRFCFIVSKRVSKTAVGRNKIKRLMREAARMALPRLKTGYDLIFTVLPGFKMADYREAGDAVKKALLKSGLIAGDKT